MTDEPTKARQLLDRARIALQGGDRQTARRLAQQAVSTDPAQKNAWLLLAELSHGTARRSYLERASRLPDANPGLSAESQPRMQASSITPESSKPKSPYLFLIITGILATLVILSAITGLMLLPIQQTVSAVDHSSPRLLGDLVKPTLTPINTPELLPTATITITPEPTWTETPEITEPSLSPIIPQVTTPEIPEIVSEGERWIDVDLTNQRTYAFEGNNLIRTFIVSTGTQYHPTVTGQYHIYVKYLYADMAGPGYYLPDVPYTMYFYKGYSFHGTYWHDNFGIPMSHGCINMTIRDSEWLFNWASVGTFVNIHY